MALGELAPIQISGKEEVRISIAINRCKHKKIFLENIKNVINKSGPGPKNVRPNGL